MGFWCAGQTEVFSRLSELLLVRQLTVFFLVPQTKYSEEIEEVFFIPFTFFLWHYLVFEETTNANRGILKCHCNFVRAEKAEWKEEHVAPSWLTGGLD